MPGFDATGPAGMGPRTGGGRGWCNPYDVPYAAYRPYRFSYAFPARPAYAYDYGRPSLGLGWGFRGRGARFGRGRGWGLARGRGWW